VRKIRTAVLGCGKVGETHAKAYNSLDQADLAGFYDPIKERAEEFAHRFGGKPYQHIEDLLDSGDVDAVSVCTPHFTHAELAVQAAGRKVHVLLEKPMAPDLKSCDRAIEACSQAGVKLGVVSQRRLYPSVLRVKEAIETGKIGSPILGMVHVLGWRSDDYYRMDSWRGRWSTEGGGVMLTQATHQLDLFQWFMGPIKEVMGYWGNLNHPEVEVEDTAVASVLFVNGALGTIALSNSQNPGLYARIHVFGSNGAGVGVQTDGGSPFISGITADVEPPVNDLWTVRGEEGELISWQEEDRDLCSRVNIMEHYHKLQIEDFMTAVLEDREPLVSGEEGRKHVELFTAVYRSQHLRRPVRFPLEADGPGSDHMDGRLIQSREVDG
jgi:UDP-N-acetyl-2-amino-2-deoxyglucuronate dehydrogenase